MRLTALVLSLGGLVALTTHTLRGATPTASTHTSTQPRQRLAPVQLKVSNEDQAAPVRLERADVQLTVAGPLTQVSQTLVFHNPSRRTLEGELTFPLPDGAAVSGFALDVQGELVDATPVEKEKARVVFEKEVRKGVDPGLLEQLEGNVFRTRVYPLPAGGTRTIRITYSTDKRTIPLRFGAAIPEGKVTVDVLGATSASVVVGKRPFTLAPSDSRLTTEAVLENSAEQDITVTIPPRTEPTVVTESFTRASSTQPETFFYLTDTPPQAKIERVAPRRIGIVWDASLSRRKADIGKELALIREHLRDKSVTVEVVVVRERAERPRTFRVTRGDSRELLAFLQAQPFDGGTALGALNLPRQDYWLWFTDGFSNLGHGLPTVAPSTPVYAVATSDSANQSLLRYFCTQTGGALSDGTDPSALGRPQVTLLGVESNGVADVQWQDGAVTGRVLRSGSGASLTLLYGIPGGPVLERRPVAIPLTATSAHGLIARQWAAQRATRLGLLPDENHEALLALGTDFNLVTPGTSLLVLESLEQYVEHNVAPPRTRPVLYDAWLGREKTEKTTKRTKDEQQLQSVLTQWKERTSWWRKEFPRTAKLAQEKKQLREDQGLTVRAAAVAPRPTTGAPPAESTGRADAARVSETRRPERRELLLRGAAPASAPSAAPGMMGGGFGGGRGRPAFGGVVAKAALPEPEPAKSLGVTIKAWTPDTPYLKSLKAAGPSGAYAAYLKEREAYASTPAFYLDCAELLLQLGRRDEGLRVLSSLADLQLEDAALLRVLAHRLAQLGEKQLAASLFEKVLRLRGEEPQSYRDLALVLADLGQIERALELLYTVVMRHWDRFEGIEVIALTEANAILAAHPKTRHRFDPRLIQNLACDVRIVMTWDSDSTDMDLHVIEPTGEECFYSHPLTQVGGKLSRDFTNGYGPEDYMIRRAVPGVYKIQTNYFGSQAQRLTGGTTVQATVITHFGHANERRQHLTLRLTQNKETVTIGEVRMN
ncbi:VIT domain-containing protein [Armatimonas rosea]|uniref:Tetratricopeptide (TPR) repeat protein n=1 Tax=Armatimonas rosea TaxID=685828 RepID=A0A7W9W5Y7_ARMRO|nr:VIT domain-containing protein [Armatimonas rosea]MBB6050914.1 tetratricopeptide (TPR) repeat protein [Armatimonas rosea]